MPSFSTYFFLQAEIQVQSKMRSNLMEKKVSQGAIQLHILRYLEQGRVNAYMSVSLQGFPERQLTAD